MYRMASTFAIKMFGFVSDSAKNKNNKKIRKKKKKKMRMKKQKNYIDPLLKHILVCEAKKKDFSSPC